MTLQAIKDKLMELNHFASLVNSRDLGSRIRLIPVSSVGHSFVCASEDTHTNIGDVDVSNISGVKMKIGEGSRIRPEDVEIPIVYSLYDPIRRAYRKSEKEVMRRGFLSRIWTRVKDFALDQCITTFMPPGLKYVIKKSDAEYIVKKMERKFITMIGWRLRVQIDEERKDLKALIDCFALNEMYFQSRYPDSEIR